MMSQQLAVMKKNISKADLRQPKVVSIPLLFKNCEIEVSTPHRNVIEPRSTRGNSTKSKQSQPRSSSTRKDSLARKDSKKVVKIDLKKSSQKTVIKAMVTAAGCKSQSHLKTKPVVPALQPQHSVMSCSKQNESTTINTDRTRTSLTTQPSLTQRLSKQSLKPSLKSRQSNIRQFQEPQQIEVESVILQNPQSQLHELRERFIKKRSEVYQVLCNLDSKFDKMKKKDNILGEIQPNSKKQILDLVREKTSPKNPALFNKTLSKPNFISIPGRKDSLSGASLKKL